jgi:hypothetical protein
MKKIIGILFFLPWLFPEATYAHAFGQQYTLPVPLWLYLYGSAAVLIVSFVIIGYFFNSKNSSITIPVSILKENNFTRVLQRSWLVSIIQIISMLLLLFTIITGIFGTNEAISNFSMTYFWIIMVLGITYLSAIFGDIWNIFNPWKAFSEWEEKVRRKKLLGIVDYPKVFSYYPALFFYFVFIWIELVGKVTPYELGYILLGYTIISNIGVAMIGKQDWFTYCDFFSVFFHLIGKISPVCFVKGKVALRPPFVGLLEGKAVDFSLLLFVLFMLSSTAFDGFHATSIYQKLLFSSPLVDTISLFNFLIFFLVIYFLFLFFMKLLANTKYSLFSLSLQFAFSLIPIAVAYNVAHYYTLLLIQGQAIVSLLSDPFGIGWNLFGTATFTPNIALLGASFIWHSQVAAILIGHIAGVYLAHVTASRVLPNKKSIFISQLPMLLLMIFYTMFGLWILSQPIVGG